MFAEDDNCGFGVVARRFRVGVVGQVKRPELVFLQCTGTLLFGGSPCGLDGDKLLSGSNLPVDVSRHLGLKAGGVQAPVAVHIVKQAGVVPLRRGQVVHAPASGLRVASSRSNGASARFR